MVDKLLYKTMDNSFGRNIACREGKYISRVKYYSSKNKKSHIGHSVVAKATLPRPSSNQKRLRYLVTWLDGCPRKFEMADGLLAVVGLGSQAMIPQPERTGWAVEEESAPLEKGTIILFPIAMYHFPLPIAVHYDILEDRVPSGLIVDYRNLLSQCEESYRTFLNLRSSLSNCNSDSEQENISMVEGLKLYSEIEQLKQKLKLIENPLLRYVFGYQKNSNIQAKGIRPNGQKVMHVVSSTMMTGLLRSLLRDRLCQEPCKEETEIQFHSDPLSAINACYEGDTVIVCPGHYMVHGTFAIADSIELEGESGISCNQTLLHDTLKKT
ncbi:SHC SH2 domain-binding protein 1, partial [Leptonychotes weddellii]|uniref:SHC SH2 domain-binding protein 1 n=1 Tax=Leptonychotes weddellii TaxID=9713 RepID=A0A2U3Z411_LEPWE